MVRLVMIHVTLDTNHVMRDRGVMADDTTSEPSSLADQRAQVTAKAILDATHRLLVNTHPATISVPAVADEAGVSVRTVYRYFPTKQALLEATANRFPTEAWTNNNRVSDDLQATYAGLHSLWTVLGENLDATRSEHQSPAGMDLRMRRLTETRSQMRKFVDKAAPDAPEHQREDLTDALIAVTSSSMFLECVDRLGRTPGQAADLAYWLAESALLRFSNDQGINLNPGDTT